MDSDSIEIDAGDDPIEHTSHQAYAVFLSAFNHQPPYQHYPLLHSWTLDPATDVHICNNTAEFQWKAPAALDDIVLAGGSEARIEAWGEVNLDKTAQPSMFPTLAPTSPSYTGIQRSQSIQAPTQTSHSNLQIQQQREPSPNPASSSRKRKRHIPVDSNLAQNRELIDSDLRPSHILSEGSKRSRKPTRKSSSFFVSTY